MKKWAHARFIETTSDLNCVSNSKETWVKMSCCSKNFAYFDKIEHDRGDAQVRVTQLFHHYFFNISRLLIHVTWLDSLTNGARSEEEAKESIDYWNQSFVIKSELSFEKDDFDSEGATISDDFLEPLCKIRDYIIFKTLLTFEVGARKYFILILCFLRSLIHSKFQGVLSYH